MLSNFCANMAHSQAALVNYIATQCSSSLSIIDISKYAAMNTIMNSQSSLKECVEANSFFTLDDKQVLNLFHKNFKYELERLQKATATVESAPQEDLVTEDLSPSQIIFGGKAYVEVDRTLVGMLALKWLKTGNYEQFTSGQNNSRTKLTKESFKRLQDLFKEINDEDTYTLLIAMVVNDLGKDPTLKNEVAKATGKTPSDVNHDVVVYMAAQKNLIPCFKNISSDQKDYLLLGLELGAKLNIAQLIQGENVPGSLEIILELRGHRKAFDIKFAEVLLDVAGAQGHKNHHGTIMSEPVFQGFMAARNALLGIIDDGNSLRKGYDVVLSTRASMLQNVGFRELSVGKKDQRALLRMFLMGRIEEKENAEIFETAFYKHIEDKHRDRLIEGLSVDGYEDGTAVIPYYMPGLFIEGLKNTPDNSPKSRIKTAASLMRFLSRIVGEKQSLNESLENEEGKGKIVEVNLLFAKEKIQSEEFKNDPYVLDDLAIPPRILGRA